MDRPATGYRPCRLETRRRKNLVTLDITYSQFSDGSWFPHTAVETRRLPEQSEEIVEENQITFEDFQINVNLPTDLFDVHGLNLASNTWVHDGRNNRRYSIADYERGIRIPFDDHALKSHKIKETRHNGIELVYVPAGEFLYGELNEKRTTEAFYIGKYELTNAQYKRFIDATGYPRLLFGLMNCTMRRIGRSLVSTMRTLRHSVNGQVSAPNGVGVGKSGARN